MFTDRENGTFRGAYHYQREIKSGFIFLNGEGPEEVTDLDPVMQVGNAKSPFAAKIDLPSG